MADYRPVQMWSGTRHLLVNKLVAIIPPDTEAGGQNLVMIEIKSKTITSFNLLLVSCKNSIQTLSVFPQHVGNFQTWVA